MRAGVTIVDAGDDRGRRRRPDRRRLGDRAVDVPARRDDDRRALHRRAADDRHRRHARRRGRRSCTPTSRSARSGPAPRSARSPTCGPAPLLREGSKAGTFVEIKNSDIGEGTKVPHLSYVGDADVGAGTNLGAAHDHRELRRAAQAPHDIGANVRTSVDTTLVAPVTVGDEAYTGAGSVVTDDVPAGRPGDRARAPDEHRRLRGAPARPQGLPAVMSAPYTGWRR